MAASWSDFQGVNLAYALELYDRFQRDPNSVDASAREWLKQLPAPPNSGTPEPRPSTDARGGLSNVEGRHLGTRNPGTSHPGTSDLRNVGTFNYVQCIRRYGHLAAAIDPLGSVPAGDPLLEPDAHDLTDADLQALPPDVVETPVAAGARSMADVIERLKNLYCSTTGYDLAHIFVPEERRWLREVIETRRYHTPADPIDPVALLERLTEVEAFEKFLHRTFPGKTRFSIEGLDTLVPILDEVISEAAEAGMRQAFVGMAHRGRLNVMAHVLGKPYEQILAEFKDPVRNAHAIEGLQWSGDVKYHLGASRMMASGDPEKEVRLEVSMPPNPSHLEAIDPVLEGMARAAGTNSSRGGAPEFDPDAVLPILIHGDAAFPGQGVVAETLNLHRLAGYTTGGTIHIIANNQIGFTTDPEDEYSTLYASGLARAFKIPIVHVNADDPEACVAAARLAFAYRAKFKRDVLIDLVGYRRYGHNEGDEPAFTQPVMYQKIGAHPTVRQLWAKTLESRGVLEAGRADAMMTSRLDQLQQRLEALDPEKDFVEPTPVVAAPGTAATAHTAVPVEMLREINDALLVVPEGFHVHRKLERGRDRRRQAFADPRAQTIDWAAAEDLALATILADGTPIRLTGEDVQRGTFSHRHAVLYDAQDGRTHTPLAALPQARAAFEVRNSPLSENAAIGFEYGYSVQAPGTLVIWEAQYGDFINGAQTMLDEFVLSARAKWGQEPSMVMLLPHGYEGQGPDHASARPERFLQLAADINMRVANCTTAAQYFHLLRRQAALLQKDPLPLVILTPKSLLRHPRVSSQPVDLSEGRWQQVIDDPDRRGSAGAVRRLIFCSGKVAIDLLTSPLRDKSGEAAVCRVEQLYPLPVRDMLGVIEGYPRLEEIVWVQEEPENMGAWEFVRPSIEGLAGSRKVAVLARPRSSSPAEGSAARHAQIQEQLLGQALTVTGTREAQRSEVKGQR
jgi:2-oxoglutarate dehydrogenase E1 component